MKKIFLENFRYVFLFFVLFYGGIIKSHETLSFSHLSVEDGLSQSTVFSIAQDANGFMWFATYEGLNKFDGYDFTVYYHSPADGNSISGDIVRIVYVDTAGRVWVGTDKGLSLYDVRNDNFHNFYPEKEASVSFVTELSEREMLVCVNNRLRIFNISERIFSGDELNNDLTRLEVSSILKSGNNIYIGDYDCNLYVYSLGKRKLRLLSAYTGKKHIQSMLMQDPDKLWIGTEGDGLYCLELTTDNVKHFKYTGRREDISSDYIRALAMDFKGQLWIGTFNDLNIYDTKTGMFEAYSHDVLDENSLSHRSIRCMYKDNQGGMWLGTYFGGLNYYHPLKNRFKVIKHIPFRNSINDNVVSCIVEDENNNL